ncbi:IEC3 subunit of the Ino80 complex, chromatin re-modelling-like protein [Stemphylium lycopersici]|uniref:IEC3 subunit of the Ino80 complex, chromatin re-modelling-like protein n=1 Tax=Stemphylium lycopersici TaxID=183478 RepID=A0A364N158_STELY|nr:IEC3 subunit of the Ino80 complex, chromatin re-modelling-like protein [Stemphylium lycopersici]RAR08958.1 IEC3 subunit of the Ino80 complex, chromatin re-modelling-like protein [Stemphylium lycopersici]
MPRKTVFSEVHRAGAVPEPWNSRTRFPPGRESSDHIALTTPIPPAIHRIMASEAAPRVAESIQEPMAPDAGDATTKPVKRSWRRKYRKMRIKFDEAMTDSDNLIKQEWKAMGTARRLQENNDQILDILLELNDQTRVNSRLRFDLRNLSPADTAVPSLEAGPDPEATKLLLQALRDDLANGKITAEDFTTQADQLHRSQAIQQTLKSLASLERKVPHTTRQDYADHPVPGIDLSEHAPGYMSPTHEDEYLLATDQLLEQPGFDQSLQHGRPVRLASAQPPLSEKDLTVRNPDSVYNWLRKHQPQVFLQDKDAAHHENLSEKSAAHKPTKASAKVKRESAIGTPGPRDHDDEDSAAPEMAKGRRKTGGGDDDTAYRPKGGSSRPTKRKREEGDTPVGKGRKKNRASTGQAG